MLLSYNKHRIIAQFDLVHVKENILEPSCVFHSNVTVKKASEGTQATGLPGAALTEDISFHYHVPIFFPQQECHL